MNVVGALVGVHCFEVDCVTKDVVLLTYAVSSHHFSCISCDLDGFHAVVTLEH